MGSPIRKYSPPNGRHFDQILGFHELEPTDFAGKTILDLGSGHSNLAGDLAEEGINAIVIGLDANQLQLKKAQAKGASLLLQANLGDPLPLKDSSVDMVLATYSYPLWASNAEQINLFYSESMRVLRAPGILSIYPNVATVQGVTDRKTMAEWCERQQMCKLAAYTIQFNEGWMVAPTQDEELVQAFKVEVSADYA